MKTKLYLKLAALVFGLVLASGAIGELVMVTLPDAMPPEAFAIPFMAKHLSAFGLRAWLFVSNLVNLGCALMFIRGAVGLMNEDADAWRPIGHAATMLAAVVVLSIPISAWYFFPVPSEPAALKATTMIGVSMIGASLGMLTMTALWRRTARRHLALA